MGIFGKLAFWKKKDDISDLGDLDRGLGGGLGKGNMAFGHNFNDPNSFGQQGQPGLGQGNDFGQGMGQGLGQGMGNYGQPAAQNNYGQYPGQNFPSQQSPSFGSPPYSQQQKYGQDEMTSKNIEVVSSKLDALRATLESINQRLENIEAIARGDEETGRRRRYY